MVSCFNSMFCCARCKKRYIRTVDAIYPRPPNEGVVMANMQKLTFYTITHPENLNKIGGYLLLRLDKDLKSQNYAQVKVAVEAMNILLQSCHTSPSLSLFLEKYLLMVQKLLETNNPDLEKMGTDLFVRFSRIEEQAPAYHREYDFFISKFSSMCYAQHGGQIKNQRYNGLRGIRGIIWKSASEDIQASIWEKHHMHKIVPSILYNFQDEIESLDNELQECRHTYGFLKCMLDPVFKHCDLHGKWVPPSIFATHTFKIILCNIQTQDSFFVLQELIGHLEQTKNAEVRNRIGIATVLHNIVTIATATIGPLLLSIFCSLLVQLKASVEYGRTAGCNDPLSECTLQDTLINVIGKFASALPDYQKVEVMMFTVSYIPTAQGKETMRVGDAYLQKVLLKTLLQIATKYKTFYFSNVFNDNFLKTIFPLFNSNDPEVRLIAQQIFQTLFDRNDNLEKLAHFRYVKDVNDLSLNIKKCMRQDELFMGKNMNVILSALYSFALKLEEGPDLKEHADSLLCSLCLICIETGHDAQLIELFRLCFALQDMALDQSLEFSTRKRAYIHNVVAKYMNLCSQLMDIPNVCQHVQETIKNRCERGIPLLNIMADPHPVNDPLEANKMSSPGRKAPIAQMDSEDDWTARSLGVESDPNLLFNLETIAEILKTSSKSVNALFKPFTTTMQKQAVPNAKDHLNVSVSSKRAHLAQRRSIPFDQKDSIDKPAINSDNEDERSLSVSSFDWSISSDMGRADAISWNEQSARHEPEVTLLELQQYANTEVDPAEESRIDQDKSSEVLGRFRGKNADEFMQLLRSPHQNKRETEATPLLRRLLGEHQQWLDSHEKARPNKIQSIDDLEFPSYFIC
ncbi:hypothetical protein M3Y97_00514100 [Aphelenchoides bicaudatus]|nr:hypothetical protein M3Y97_00514100 [Aphelenchoides bicaudatus]